jgi:hypothetical protein
MPEVSRVTCVTVARMFLNDRGAAGIPVAVTDGAVLAVTIPPTLVTIKQRRANQGLEVGGPNRRRQTETVRAKATIAGLLIWLASDR